MIPWGVGSIEDVGGRGIDARGRSSPVLPDDRGFASPTNDLAGDNSVGRRNRCVFGGDDAMSPSMELQEMRR